MKIQIIDENDVENCMSHAKDCVAYAYKQIRDEMFCHLEVDTNSIECKQCSKINTCDDIKSIITWINDYMEKQSYGEERK